MKKLGVIFKETSEKQIKNRLKDSGSFFVIGYSSISGADLTSLRISLKNIDASLFVVKNSVVKRALKSCGHEAILPKIEGPCAMVFSSEEPVDTTKALYEFNRRNENLKLLCGFMKEKVLEKADIVELAKLPGKEALRAKLVMLLNSPISRLAMALNWNLKKLVICLEQIKNKKSG